jgi:hypothetical protein
MQDFFWRGEIVFLKGILQILVRRTWFLDGFLWTNCGENVVFEGCFFAAENFPLFRDLFFAGRPIRCNSAQLAHTPGTLSVTR